MSHKIKQADNLLDTTQGGWIAYTDWVQDSRPVMFHPVAFRKDFVVGAKPRGGRLLITAAHKYGLWLNGRLVGYGPARSYPRRKFYDPYDIGPLLRKGVNRLAVMVSPSNGVNFLDTYTRMGLFLQAEIVSSKGEKIRVVSDASWQTRIANWIKLDYRLISLPIGSQEHSDQTRQDHQWKVSTPDARWTEALYLGSAGMPPWIEILPRPTPLLEESVIMPALVWRGTGSRSLVGIDQNLALAFNQQRLTGKMVPAKSADRTFCNDSESVWTFDFGKTRTVRPAIDIRTVTGPVRFELFYDIKLEGRPTASLGFNSPMEGSCDSCAVAHAPHTWEALVPRGLRFITVKVSGPGRAEFRLACRSVDYPYPRDADFQTPDAFLSSVWKVSSETIRSSTSDTAVDCCSRENLLWTMDAAVTLKAAYYTFGETAMWRHCLDLIAQGIDVDGRPSAVVPTDVPSSLFGQTMHWVTALEEYFRATGDVSLLNITADSLRRYLRYCSAHFTGDELFLPPSWSWHWVDWAPIDMRPHSLPMNVLLLIASQTAGRIAKVIADQPLAREAASMTRRLSKAIPRFFDSRREAFRTRMAPSGRLTLPPDRDNNKSTEVAKTLTHGVHGNILAFRAGCGTPEMRQAALRHAVACLQQPSGPINRIGMSYMEILLAPLLAQGYGSVAMEKLRATYQPYLDAGAPTWSSQPPSGSRVESPFNTAHGWSASVNSLIVESIIGLRPAAPGWRGMILAPPHDVRADYHYTLKTPAGPVEVECADGHRAARWPKGVRLSYGGKKHAGTGKMRKLDPSPVQQ